LEFFNPPTPDTHIFFFLMIATWAFLLLTQLNCFIKNNFYADDISHLDSDFKDWALKGLEGVLVEEKAFGLSGKVSRR
jgi:hypothetical protein